MKELVKPFKIIQLKTKFLEVRRKYCSTWIGLADVEPRVSTEKRVLFAVKPSLQAQI